MAIQALEKMETRKFKAKIKGQREASCGASDSVSSSSTSDCAICLEKYIDGEVIIFINVQKLVGNKKTLKRCCTLAKFPPLVCQFSKIYSKTKLQANRLKENGKPLLHDPGKLVMPSSLFYFG